MNDVPGGFSSGLVALPPYESLGLLTMTSVLLWQQDGGISFWDSSLSCRDYCLGGGGDVHLDLRWGESTSRACLIAGRTFPDFHSLSLHSC